MSTLMALLAACLYGAGDFCGGLAVRRAPVFAVTALSQAVGLVVLAMLAPLTAAWPGLGQELVWGAAAGVCGGAGVALLYQGLAGAAASVVAPVSGLVALVLPVLVGWAIGERPAGLVWLGIALAAVAVTLIGGGAPAAHTAHGQRGRALMIAMASGLFIGAFLVCLGRTPPSSGMWPLLAARAVSASVFAPAIWRGSGGVGALRPVLGLAVACGLLDMGANTFYLLAVRGGDLSVIATLTNLYPASTVALAALFLGERPRPVQWAGFGLALLAMVMITV